MQRMHHVKDFCTEVSKEECGILVVVVVVVVVG